MPFVTIFVMALALAMDAFAVSIATGVQLRAVTVAQTLRMGGTFGGFQFLMPVIGWFLGFRAHEYIASYDHWLAFALLAFVGGKMILEAVKSRSGDNAASGDKPAPNADPTKGAALVLLGVATSLDALAVGLSLALLKVQVWQPALIIGLVCFCLTVAGLHLGARARAMPGLNNLGDKANILGGLVLLAIGLKILLDHNVFS